MKKVRSNGIVDLPQSVEGVESEDAIAEKFREVYEALYNSAETTTDSLKQTISDLIDKELMSDVENITGGFVKTATVKIKPRKSYISGGFTSDCLLHGLDILFSHLATVFPG